MLRMDQVHVIRHKVLREGASIRQVARELGLSRNTVSKYLDQSVPVYRTYRRRKRRECNRAWKNSWPNGNHGQPRNNG
jgi:predicted transcriptional regulator